VEVEVVKLKCRWIGLERRGAGGGGGGGCMEAYLVVCLFDSIILVVDFVLNCTSLVHVRLTL